MVSAPRMIRTTGFLVFFIQMMFFLFFCVCVLVWLPRRLKFKGRRHVLRKWFAEWSFKDGKGIKYILHPEKDLKIRFEGKWRSVKRFPNGLFYIKMKGWERIYYRGNNWMKFSKGRLTPLSRDRKSFRIKFQRRWYPLQYSNRGYKIFYRKWISVMRRPAFAIRYLNKWLKVKKNKRGLYRVFSNGRWSRARRGRMCLNFGIQIDRQ